MQLTTVYATKKSHTFSQSDISIYICMHTHFFATFMQLGAIMLDTQFTA